ncbi:MAG: alanine racemase [Bacilli bacterium]
MYPQTYVEINLDNIQNNIQNILKKYPEYSYYIGIVKANAYGHGMYIINELVKNGVNYLAVSSLKEAVAIRKYNQTIPILCLEPVNIFEIDTVVKYDITIIIHDLLYFNQLIKIKNFKKIKVHLKIDSGMNRLGLNDKNIIKTIVDEINKDFRIILEGIFSHFATTGIADKNWDQQLNNFIDLTSLIDLKKIPIVHIGRSLTALIHPKISFCTGIRLGIIMYGYNTTPQYSKTITNHLRLIKQNWLIKKNNISKTVTTNNIKLLTALELYTTILQIKQVNKGQYVGYGTTYQAKENIYVATIAAGYADGICRRNSGRNVIINNKLYPIIGEIGMNMLSVKIDETIKITDLVKLIGTGINIREVSYYIGNSTYETLAMIPKNITRIYFKDNKKIYTEET